MGCNYLCLPEILASGVKILIYQYIDITLSIIDTDFLYQFNLRLHHFSRVFFSMPVKKKFFKSWQVCDWLAKWLIMLGFMDLRWPRVARRSNVSLVIIPPASTKLKGGYTGFTSSVRLFSRLYVCPSVCGQNRVHSVTSTILSGSISYLHILSTNFMRCVACYDF